MKAFKARLDRLLGGFVALAMGLAVLTVLWQVASRYLLGDPSSFTDELVRYLLIWIGLLGGAYAVGQRMHLAIDLVPAKPEGARRHLADLAVQGLVFLFALAVLGVGGIELVRLSFALGQKSAALGVPLGWVYMVLPLSGLLVMVYCGIFMVEGIRSSSPPGVGGEGSRGN